MYEEDVRELFESVDRLGGEIRELETKRRNTERQLKGALIENNLTECLKVDKTALARWFNGR